jgi:hypothetical protein
MSYASKLSPTASQSRPAARDRARAEGRDQCLKFLSQAREQASKPCWQRLKQALFSAVRVPLPPPTIRLRAWCIGSDKAQSLSSEPNILLYPNGRSPTSIMKRGSSSFLPKGDFKPIS